ncbi:MAG: hypothetical protein QY332_19480 [Anaerolineales bacterium]|nr:MAG: hypothetical protein QY332_19480 [Anaerolineales bacterium]
MTTPSSFSAAESLTGYLYQVRYALLDALRRVKDDIRFTVSIETLDDIVFETEGQPIELLQAKHHSKPANLTDTSNDLWKTIRIWVDQYKTNLGFRFYLVTTAKVANGSAAYYLQANQNRDVSKAISRLDAISQSSTNKGNLAGYDAYRSLNSEEKEDLIDRVTVLDATPTILDLEKELRREVFHAVDIKYLDSFIIRLEGWWYRRALQHLNRDNQKPILAEEIIAEEANLREQFKQDNLVVDEDILSATIDESGYQDRLFVQQLKLIDLKDKRIFIAIRDYFRAFEQRSRWVREELLQVGELDKYEARLMEDWEIRFEQLRDQIGDQTAENEKRRLAQELYSWIETGNLQQVRPQVNEPSMARGSYHILSDNQVVGWHPEFKQRLIQLIGVGG